MRTLFRTAIYAVFFLVLFVISSCEKDTLTSLEYGISPVLQKDLLCKSMRLEGKNIQGIMPSGVGTGSPIVVSHPTAVEISAGVLLFIPYWVNDTSRVCKIFLQVDGADNYWETSLKLDPSSRQPFFQILIPKFVQEGNFDLVFSVADCTGNVSRIYNTRTNVKPLADCNSSISGSVGITVRAFNLGPKAGTAKFSYEMYSIKDRLDIRYNGKWVASTGNLFNDNVLIPNCDGNQNGFVSGTGQLSFQYNPRISRFVEVYVSGCNSGTLWDISAVCPE